MARGTLDGIKVLDFTIAVVGAFCSRILADMGAEVWKIDYPSRANLSKADEDPLGRFNREALRAQVTGVIFLNANGGKKSVGINLKHPKGVELVKELAKHADIVMENFTPRVLRSYGLDYPKLRAINPSIVMLSMTGYGQQGMPYSPDHPCTDPVAHAMSGLNWITGPRNGPPYAISGGSGDTVTSLCGAIAITQALFHRERTGQGQHIDLSMAESLLFTDSYVLPYVAANNGENIYFRNGQMNSLQVPMGTLKAKEGYIAMQCGGEGRDSPWGRLCIAMGREELIDDPNYRTDVDRVARSEEVVGIVEGWLQSLPDDEAALVLLAEARVPSGPVLSQQQMLEYPLFKERGAFGTVEYPELGPVKVVEPPYKFSETPAFVRGPAPQLGEHNYEVLTKHLGLSAEEIKALTGEGVLFESEAARRRRRSHAPVRR